jgi:hypothetical protein
VWLLISQPANFPREFSRSTNVSSGQVKHKLCFSEEHFVTQEAGFREILFRRSCRYVIRVCQGQFHCFDLPLPPFYPVSVLKSGIKSKLRVGGAKGYRVQGSILPRYAIQGKALYVTLCYARHYCLCCIQPCKLLLILCGWVLWYGECGRILVHFLSLRSVSVSILAGGGN